MTPVSSDADSEEGVLLGVGGEEVKVKQRSFIRRKKTVVRGDDDDCTDVGMVCIQCFRLLKALAKNYPAVQERYMKVQKVYLLQQSQILRNSTQCLLRHSQAYKNVQKAEPPRCLALRTRS